LAMARAAPLDALADSNIPQNTARASRSVASHASRRIPITAMTTAVATCTP
jgi:hypothetical protein